MSTAVGIMQQNMRWYRICSCVVQGWMYSSTCVGTGTVQGFPFFHDSPPTRGASDPSPGGQRTTLTARRVGHGTRYSPGTKKGCCVSGTWRHSEAAGRRVALETRSCFQVCYNRHVFKDLFEHDHYDHHHHEECITIKMLSKIRMTFVKNKDS